MVVLYGGRIRAAGTAEELLTDTSRTVVTTQRLAPETIARLDKLLHDLQGTGVDKVESPRERLEDFFMELVEKARQEQVATSGAQHGGRTAAFLAADEPKEGAGVIDQLLRDAPAPAARAVEVVKQAEAKGPRTDVLEDLLKTAPAPEKPATPAPKVERPNDVDAGVIDDLLGGGDGRRGGGTQ
jgi:ABC-2 type transport system ATP-binding protein